MFKHLEVNIFPSIPYNLSINIRRDEAAALQQYFKLEVGTAARYDEKRLTQATPRVEVLEQEGKTNAWKQLRYMEFDYSRQNASGRNFALYVRRDKEVGCTGSFSSSKLDRASFTRSRQRHFPPAPQITAIGKGDETLPPTSLASFEATTTPLLLTRWRAKILLAAFH